MPLVFVKPALVEFDSNAVSDHNRSPLTISVERIEHRVRTGRGMLRKFHVDDKRSYTMSWEMLPEKAADTVDGFWGAGDLITFYHATPGPFTLRVVKDTGEEESIEVIFDSFSSVLRKRWDSNYWNIDLGLEEV